MSCQQRGLRRRGVALLAAALPVAAALAQAPRADPPASSAARLPSEAERLVFLHEHLANARQPRVLRYRYVEETAGKPRVEDSAVLTLSAGAAGRCCNVHGDYRHGALAVNLPDIQDAHANPVLLYFLESEVRLLQRTTRGEAAHFRRRIRQALADSATVAPTTIRWNGQSVPATNVRVVPYADDPYRVRFSEQAATEYLFVLSDAVPGGVYEIGATLPGKAAGDPPLARRTLTLADQN